MNELHHHRLRQLDTLIEISGLITSIFDIEEIKRRAVEAATGLVGAEAGSLLLLDAEQGCLTFEVACGQSGSCLETLSFDKERGIAGAVLESGVPVLVPDVQRDHRFFPEIDRISGLTTREMLCVPVKTREKTLGVLQTINKKEGHFREDDLPVLHALANQVAIAIENARLHLEIRTDSLTGLYQQKFFEIRLREEMERALRYGEPLCLMMADLDFFKRVNDEYGHLAGNQVLRGFAKLLRECTRSSDIVARFGGEEFCAILHHARLENAQMVCERLRQATERATFGEARVTVSIGVGLFDPTTMGQDTEAFVRSIDRALYRAKANGRNRVEVS